MKTPPLKEVEVAAERTKEARCDEGFLRLRRMELVNHRPDGGKSALYRYDFVERDAIDAVVLLIWARVGDQVQLCMRASMRPPLTFRREYELPIETPDENVLWEVPAGLIERDEKGEEGIRRCAARETLEETGFVVDSQSFVPLGKPTYLCPGVIAEKLYYFSAEVRADERGVPTEDGSPVEENALVQMVSLPDVMRALDSGVIRDAKTEVAIRRFVASRGEST